MYTTKQGPWRKREMKASISSSPDRICLLQPVCRLRPLLFLLLLLRRFYTHVFSGRDEDLEELEENGPMTGPKTRRSWQRTKTKKLGKRGEKHQGESRPKKRKSPPPKFQHRQRLYRPGKKGMMYEAPFRISPFPSLSRARAPLPLLACEKRNPMSCLPRSRSPPVGLPSPAHEMSFTGPKRKETNADVLSRSLTLLRHFDAKLSREATLEGTTCLLLLLLLSLLRETVSTSLGRGGRLMDAEKEKEERRSYTSEEGDFLMSDAFGGGGEDAGATR